MDNFQKTYDEYIEIINENALKSIATAGMIGLGAIGATKFIHPSPKSSAEAVYQSSDNIIINKTMPITAWAEGFRDTAYLDTKNNPTIGYGLNLNSEHICQKLEKMGYSISSLKSKRQKISKSDAEILLKDELERSLIDAKKFIANWDELDPNAQMVLVDMAYNMGYTKLSKFVKFKAALENLDYARAKAEMINSKWYTDVGRRSKYLSEIMGKISR